MNHKGCEDDLMLQRFLDEELSPDAAEIVLYHLEKCMSCAEKLQDLKIAKAFCREQFGHEDELESEFTQNALLRIRDRLEIPKAAPSMRRVSSTERIAAFFDRFRSKMTSFTFNWRVMTVPAALFLVFAGLAVWLAISPSSNISAEEILSKSEQRTAIWQNQPGKVLHWVVEANYSNQQFGYPDGKYRSLYWQNNTGGKSRQLIRRYDENGKLVWAMWQRADGSVVTFSRFPEEEIRISPSIEELKAYAAGLEEKSRQTLEKFVASFDRLAQKTQESDSHIKRQDINRWSEKGSVQIVHTADIGKIFRVRSVIKPYKMEKFIYGEMEYDIAADSFMRHRLRTVRYYAGGKTAIEDSRLIEYKETSAADFDAHDLSAEMRQVKRIAQETPEETLKIATRFEEAKKSSQSHTK